MGRGPHPRAEVAHLVRRIAFGAPAQRIDELADLGFEEAVEALTAFNAPDPDADAVTPPTFDTAGYLAAQDGDEAARQAAAQQARRERRALPVWWLRRMVAAAQPGREKLTLLWHDHFATSIEKVKIAELMYRQQQLLHSMAAGRFDQLVHAVARDAAMLIWLDGRESTRGAPNENFARELFELFTLGHPGQHGGHGGETYTEQDVADASRALSGWQIDRQTGAGVLNPRRHDSGPKVVLGRTGALGLDEVVEAATQHPNCAPHVTARLWSRLARPAEADDPVVVELAAPFARDLDVSALVRRMLLHPDFRTEETRRALVRMPVELVAGTHRALGVTPDDTILLALAGLGQVPFVPPDVAGWPAGPAWLSTASARARLAWADALARSVDDRVLDDGEPAHLARLLGVDGWSEGTEAVLADADDPVQALTLAIVSPEHVAA